MWDLDCAILAAGVAVAYSVQAATRRTVIVVAQAIAVYRCPMPQRSAVLLILTALCGCAQGHLSQNLILTRQECAEGKKWACDILPEAENDAAQEQADAARTAGALAVVAASAAAAGYAAAHPQPPQPVYVMPVPTVTQPVTTTCQQNGTMTTCTSE